MFKSKKLKSKKTLKSWNLAKLEKKLLNNGNLSNFSTIKVGPKFLISDTRIAFNCLWLVFTKVLIPQYFDPECHIWIETNILGYAIGKVLN